MRQKSRIAVCAAFKNGFELISFILDNGYRVELVITSDKDDSRYEAMISELCGQRGIPLARSINANSDYFINALTDKAVDLVFLAWWPSIISKQAIEAAKIGWVNLHPSLLPYNRGKHPYYWSIIDGTPFGVTLHFIDPGTDTGEILFQEQIEVLITDTGASLYKKGDDAALDIFKKHFDELINLQFVRAKQNDGSATMHYAKDIAEHSRIDLDRTYKAQDLINIIRARTFPGGDSAYFHHEGKKYHIRLSIEETNA